MFAQMASVKNAFNGSGIDGGFGSALLIIKCSISTGNNFPLLSRILKVKIAATISLCFSKRPLLVKWNDTCEIESISWSILPFSDLGERGSSSSPYPPSSSLPSSFPSGFSSILVSVAGCSGLGYVLGAPSFFSPSAGGWPSFFSSAGVSCGASS
jgi:hypothetical protein